MGPVSAFSLPASSQHLNTRYPDHAPRQASMGSTASCSRISNVAAYPADEIIGGGTGSKWET